MPALSPGDAVPFLGKDRIVNERMPKEMEPAEKGDNASDPLIGAHFSIAKGLHHAVTTAGNYDCRALQLFTKNALTWEERFPTETEIEAFAAGKKHSGITDTATHASYLINIASPDPVKLARSAGALKQELIRSAMIDAANCILHPGAHMGAGIEAGILKIADTINDIFEHTRGNPTCLLLETTAGQGSSIGHTFEQLARIIDKIRYPHRIGICLDTCHIFAAGYDIRTEAAYRRTLDRFHSLLGLDSLKVIHVNDAKKDLNSRVDRHEHIGRGFIGPNAFRFLMNDERLLHIPKILETPKGTASKDWDQRNLDTLRQFSRADRS
jgi:deoxyribonuclease-4